MHQTTIRYSIFGVDLEPSVVANTLGVPADMSREPVRSSGLSDASTGEAETGMYSFSSSGHVEMDAEFEMHAAWLLARLESHVGDLRLWSGKGWQSAINVLTVDDKNTGHVVISADTLGRLASLGVTMQLVVASRAKPEEFAVAAKR